MKAKRLMITTTTSGWRRNFSWSGLAIGALKIGCFSCLAFIIPRAIAQAEAPPSKEILFEFKERKPGIKGELKGLDYKPGSTSIFQAIVRSRSGGQFLALDTLDDPTLTRIAGRMDAKMGGKDAILQIARRFPKPPFEFLSPEAETALADAVRQLRIRGVQPNGAVNVLSAKDGMEVLRLEALRPATDKERVATFQVAAQHWDILGRAHALGQANEGIAAAEANARRLEQNGRGWLRRNDLGSGVVPSAARRDFEAAVRVREAARQSLERARRDLQNQSRIYAAHAKACRLAGHGRLADAMDEFLKAVNPGLSVSPDAAKALVGFIAAKIALHYYEPGDRQELLTKHGLIWVTDIGLSQLVDEIFPELPEAARGAIVGCINAATQGKLSQEEIVGGALAEGFRRKLPKDLANGADVLERLVAFFREAAKVLPEGGSVP